MWSIISGEKRTGAVALQLPPRTPRYRLYRANAIQAEVPLQEGRFGYLCSALLVQETVNVKSAQNVTVPGREHCASHFDALPTRTGGAM